MVVNKHPCLVAGTTKAASDETYGISFAALSRAHIQLAGSSLFLVADSYGGAHVALDRATQHIQLHVHRTHAILPILLHVTPKNLYCGSFLLKRTFIGHQFGLLKLLWSFIPASRCTAFYECLLRSFDRKVRTISSTLRIVRALSVIAA